MKKYKEIYSKSFIRIKVIVIRFLLKPSSKSKKIDVNKLFEFCQSSDVGVTEGVDCFQETFTKLEKLIANRRSIREFSDNTIAIEILKKTLYTAIGASSNTKHRLKNYPSAGGLYPLDIYLVNFHVEHLDRSIYKYNQNNGVLVNTNSKRTSIIKRHLESDYITKSAFAIVFVNNEFKNSLKYNSRGIQYSFIEAGHIAQNLILIAEENGISSVPIGMFSNKILSNELNLDSEVEYPIYALLFGTKKM